MICFTVPIRLRCHRVLYECVDTLTVSHFDSSPTVKTTARRKIHCSSFETSKVALSRNFTTWQNTADLDTTSSRVSFVHMSHLFLLILTNYRSKSAHCTVCNLGQPKFFFGIVPQTPRGTLGQNLSGHQFSATSDVIWPRVWGSEGP